MEWEETLTGAFRPADRRASSDDSVSPPGSARADAEGSPRRRYDFSSDGYDRMLRAFENGELPEADARRFFGGHFDDVKAALDR